MWLEREASNVGPPATTTAQHRQLDDLILASHRVRRRAASAIAQSAALVPETARLRSQSLASRVASRRGTHYALVDGVVEGRSVSAVVRRDGSVDGDPALVRRARLVVAMGDTFDGDRLSASLGADPLASILTLTRACDETRMIQMGGGRRGPARPID